MKKRFITSIFIVLVTFLAIISKFLPYEIGTYIFDLFIITICVFSQVEICNILEKSGKKVNKFFSVFYPIINYGIFLIFNNLLNYKYMFLVQVGFLLIYAIILYIYESIKNLKTSEKNSFNTIINSIFSFVYPGLLFGLFININHSDNFAINLGFSFVFVIIIFAITMLTDTFAYLVGRTFKGPKLAPTISPNKTISGAIGGLFGGVIGAMLVFLIVYNVKDWAPLLTLYSLNWWHFLLVGALGSIIGQIGDLFESKLKRNANIKDSGSIFPGHGGMLDRIDAMTFVALFIFIVTFVVL